MSRQCEIMMFSWIESERCLIFVETKRSADYLGALLSQKGLMSTTMHGDRTQQQREAAVRDFSKKKCQILVATSVAARGLDFPLIGYVVNYDLPDSSDFYIHRIGRTGSELNRVILFFETEWNYFARSCRTFGQIYIVLRSRSWLGSSYCIRFSCKIIRSSFIWIHLVNEHISLVSSCL